MVSINALLPADLPWSSDTLSSKACATVTHSPGNVQDTGQ